MMPHNDNGDGTLLELWLKKTLSVAALEIVILTTASAAHEKSFVKRTIFLIQFQCVHAGLSS